MKACVLSFESMGIKSQFPINREESDSRRNQIFVLFLFISAMYTWKYCLFPHFISSHLSNLSFHFLLIYSMLNSINSRVGVETLKSFSAYTVIYDVHASPPPLDTCESM